MKVTSNYTKLLKILIILLGLLCAILVVGVFTRQDTKLERMYSELSAELNASRASESELAKTNEQLLESLGKEREKNKHLQAQVHDLSIKIQELNKQIEIDSLSDKERYINYAYNIGELYYPDIPSEYVCAIMKRESEYDPTKRNSRTGVQGLTQISPKWHTKRAESLGVNDLYDPYGNILVCYDILHELTLANDFDYAINFYAGGYRYADRYRDSTSPVKSQLIKIIESENYEQYLLPYSII